MWKVRVRIIKKMKRMSKFNGKVREIKKIYKRESLRFVIFDEKVREMKFNSIK